MRQASNNRYVRWSLMAASTLLVGHAVLTALAPTDRDLFNPEATPDGSQVYLAPSVDIRQAGN